MMRDLSLERKKIKMELCRSNNKSYYIDANGLLKGEWGGFEEDYGRGRNNEHIYGVYYTRIWNDNGKNWYYSEMIPIDEYGYFYNKFNCKKYDCVYKEREGLYITVKNNRLGLIDENENILLHTVYNNILSIQYMPDNVLVCIVTTETGKFLYNISTEKISKEYDDIFYASHKSEWNCENHFFFKFNDKFGIIDVNGNMILPAIYNCFRYASDTKLTYHFKKYEYNVFIKDGLFYGIISLEKYDTCFRVGNKREGFYITMLKGELGLLTSKGIFKAKPYFDDIILYKTYDKSGFHIIRTRDKRNNRHIVLLFVIAKKGNKYWLYNAFTGKCYLESCDRISFHDGHFYNSNPYIEFERKGVQGYVMSGGVILTLDDYDDIYIEKDGIIITKHNKKGLLDMEGYELLPCVYDDIQRKGQDIYLVIKEGVQETKDFHMSSLYSYSMYESHHYGGYSGSYAQDEMGYSDEDIDTIFDGNPSAYWNID